MGVGLSSVAATSAAVATASTVYLREGNEIQKILFQPSVPTYTPRLKDGFRTLRRSYKNKRTYYYWQSWSRKEAYKIKHIVLYCHGNSEDLDKARYTLLLLLKTMTEVGASQDAENRRDKKETKRKQEEEEEKNDSDTDSNSDTDSDTDTDNTNNSTNNNSNNDSDSDSDNENETKKPKKTKHYKAGEIGAVAVGYPGYAPADYKDVAPSDARSRHSAWAIAMHLHQQYPEARFTIAGYSIGAAIAAALAARIVLNTRNWPLDRLALLAPFSSPLDCAKNLAACGSGVPKNLVAGSVTLLVKEDLLNTTAHLLNVQKHRPDVPILLVHGTKDSVIPHINSLRLNRNLRHAYDLRMRRQRRLKQQQRRRQRHTQQPLLLPPYNVTLKLVDDATHKLPWIPIFASWWWDT